MLGFDWWIRNGDRCLGELGGNPNLFWAPKNRSLVLFDHNQAFDPGFSPAEFRVTHAFAGTIPLLFADRVLQRELADRFIAALDHWADILAAIPSAWWYTDEEKSVTTDFDPCEVMAILERYQQTDFWIIT